MEAVPLPVLWALGLFVGAITIAAQLTLGCLVCHALVRLAARVPGPLGWGVRVGAEGSEYPDDCSLCLCRACISALTLVRVTGPIAVPAVTACSGRIAR